MDANRETLEALVRQPSETLDVELKGWLFLDRPEHVATLVRALFALRNRNGGVLLVGFGDKSHQPEPIPPNYDPQQVFHVDRIQSLVSRHAVEPFAVSVEFVERDGKDHPVIRVASGVQYPVAVKSGIPGQSGRELLRVGEVMFRTLRTNGTVSSAAAHPGDWKEIMEICFQNREADVGSFIRRHLSDLDVPGLMKGLAETSYPSPSRLSGLCTQFLDSGRERFAAVLEARGSKSGAQAINEWGSWEAVLIIDPPVTNRAADGEFRATVVASVPKKDVEWPLWVDTAGWADTSVRPVQVNHGWETLIDSFEHGLLPMVHFWRAEPNGRFYSLSTLSEDSHAAHSGKKSRVAFDPANAVRRVAHAMLAGRSVANSLGCDAKGTTLGFAFRWRGLSGRGLVAWLSVLRIIRPEDISRDDEIVSSVQLPMEVAPSAIAPYVEEATKALFASFNGYAIPKNTVEQQIQALTSGSP